MCLGGFALLYLAWPFMEALHNHCGNRNRNRLPSHSSGRALSNDDATAGQIDRWDETMIGIEYRDVSSFRRNSRSHCGVSTKGILKRESDPFSFQYSFRQYRLALPLYSSIWSDDCGLLCSIKMQSHSDAPVRHNVHNTVHKRFRVPIIEAAGEERNALDCEVRE